MQFILTKIIFELVQWALFRIRNIVFHYRNNILFVFRNLLVLEFIVQNHQYSIQLAILEGNLYPKYQALFYQHFVKLSA